VKWPPETVEECSKYYEAAYKAGNKRALILMIGACGLSGWIIPKWVTEVIVGADDYAASGELKSWDEVFGKPPTLKRAERVHDWDNRHRVLHAVLKASAKGEPIDDLLFERVGKKLGIGGKTKVKELYRLARDELSQAMRINAEK
jgi:hypothetical protein